MKKIFLVFTCFCFKILFPQDFIGFNQSNYAGVTGLYQQPASIVGSRMKYDMTLVGFNLYAYNNYVGIKKTAFKPNAIDEENYFKNNFIEKINNDDKSLYFSNRINGPSFMINLNQKNAIALSTCVRNYINIDGISPELAKLTYSEFEYPSLWIARLNNKNLSIQEMSWGECGLTYAHIFKEDNEHYFKAGATFKLLQGIQSAYVFIKDLKYEFKADTVVSLFQSEVIYGHSDNFDVSQNSLAGTGNSPSVFNFTQAYPGFGFDFGAVYEWRPNYKKYQYNLDGKTNLWRKDQSKYKLKIGVSLTDFGSITYKKGATSGDFKADIGFWNLKAINPKTVKELDDTLNARFGGTKTTGQTYNMNLPTAISLQIDYHIWKTLYVNLTPFIALQHKSKLTKVHDISSITVTPRWDHKWFGVFIPIQYNSLDGYRGGLALRLGPLILGTTSFAPLITKQKIYGADFYTLLKIPIPYGKPKDKDHDGVSDKKDLCKTIPGLWQFDGCPDTDNDSIKDSDDKCPEIPGIKELCGCPDADGDSITDLEDDCPNEKGLAKFRGCPDRDEDDIIDKQDSCPDIKGLPLFFGCPDNDNDSIPDKEDKCPDLAGPRVYNGCPDKDGDTVIDQDDACPDSAGVIENKGCPWPDTDKDSVIDRDDECPLIAGLVELKGCLPAPVLKVEEQKILEKAFASLEFASGKDIIKKTSLPSLTELAGLMKQHADEWTLKLSGHTDNKGDSLKNTILSEKRAKAVKTYLVTKGVNNEKIFTEWFGPTKPIEDNGTELGRQKNRRVEMKVEYKK